MSSVARTSPSRPPAPSVGAAGADSTAPSRTWRQALLETLLILAVFYVHAGWPVPDVNETHYLPLAKKAWDPGWLAGDFFLESPQAHLTFTYAFGWATRLLSLPAFAWIGRLLSWTFLAWAWQRLSWAVVPRRFFAVLSAALYLFFLENFQMAGEWVLGGFEAKPIAYGFVWLALEAMLRERWSRAWIFIGAASAFHVLVGGWSAIALGVAWALVREGRPSLVSMLPALAGGAALALLGLVPALAVSWHSEPEVIRQANEIYVYERFDHHLVHTEFRPDFLVAHAILVTLWLVLSLVLPVEGGMKRLRVFVFTAFGIAAVGVFLGYAASREVWWGPALLRYYWFRMSDSMVPLGVALWLVAYVDRAGAARPAWGKLWLAVAILLAGWHAGLHATLTPLADRPRADKPNKVGDYEDWLRVTSWIRENTPEDARFLTPYNAQSFKWYTHRSEVVTWKDIPQDPEGVTEWWRRMHTVHGRSGKERHWFRSLNQRDETMLRKLGEEYGAGYLLTQADTPLALPRVFPKNAEDIETYVVYRLDE